jgi:hypothetical protein
MSLLSVLYSDNDAHKDYGNTVRELLTIWFQVLLILLIRRSGNSSPSVIIFMTDT